MLDTLKWVVLWGFVLGLNYYLITLLQWYNYSFSRVLTKHHKRRWHIYHALLPLAVFVITQLKHWDLAFIVFVGGVQLPALLFWRARLDKPLVFTPRVVRFFTLLLLFLSVDALLAHAYNQSFFWLYLLLIALVHIAYKAFEALIAQGYVRLAKDKLRRMKDLQIIAITGSFGKTSVKNYLYQMLQGKFTIYSSLDSVNTLLGLSQDINNNLEESATLYIAEAGARQKDDIKAISKLLAHHYAIIAEIGNQHIEYFKNMETIYATKAEILQSPRLIRAFCHEKNPLEPFYAGLEGQIQPYPGQVRAVSATLEGTSFELFLDNQWLAFETKILGAFNVDNIALAVLIGRYFEIPAAQLQRLVSKLKPVPHRLHPLHLNDKFIIDDGFNGNLKGMLESVRLASLYPGRKVIVTPGLVESDEESNATLAQAIEEVFDIVVVTGELNADLFTQHLSRPQKVFLRDKSQLEQVLQTITFAKDLILFANDAPNYI
ncbi:Mur ligase family protein [Helicobacter ailurogastricus]|uniref:UDP-N-acetylmuramoyl-tripeptide--D-alanyl-D-alanine ligase n=1 Tax=Helicobacter ailurogastricus TaxID=1578720 RepID=A0A0K2XAM7_9HELI|nr:UDP-N-acetylmuramoyl-tripeptide--D-alanyl-D-alanine ligase [Helicobacter ailurogastricus]CRF40739.1 UDP-N-acetylmuramoyl-tripeptide--D-alanyl-D-alanine ligase [Helicobacter ailurogastricus]CRF43131.1 UDP-N-acetylmuramoyl-tripeptide--D-alanyl-D-alanine ligase [Helicobacter ailurogastricus]CRF44360.1 UDP-N-acetylmuramoyl-tripeptide--D-alanyl-D-alanine ligase [Helicobacter ailurogastricus]CRF52167.1 UDP-N-acetylmuramoylalanyl-D-glutamyl-2,6-diaminopimelate--D-alanyl-D-alanine ligase [Helicobact